MFTWENSELHTKCQHSNDSWVARNVFDVLMQCVLLITLLCSMLTWKSIFVFDDLFSENSYEFFVFVSNASIWDILNSWEQSRKSKEISIYFPNGRSEFISFSMLQFDCTFLRPRYSANDWNVVMWIDLRLATRSLIE